VAKIIKMTPVFQSNSKTKWSHFLGHSVRLNTMTHSSNEGCHTILLQCGTEACTHKESCLNFEHCFFSYKHHSSAAPSPE